MPNRSAGIARRLHRVPVVLFLFAALNNARLDRLTQRRSACSSFWERPFQNKDNVTLFEKEREDLFKELRDLPRYSAIRKINDLVKRARHVKVLLARAVSRA